MTSSTRTPGSNMSKFIFASTTEEYRCPNNNLSNCVERSRDTSTVAQGPEFHKLNSVCHNALLCRVQHWHTTSLCCTHCQQSTYKRLVPLRIGGTRPWRLHMVDFRQHTYLQQFDDCWFSTFYITVGTTILESQSGRKLA
jgi:hypothetical protein